MNKINIECKYCGNKWEKIIWGNPSSDGLKCEVCGEGQNFFFREIKTSNIDYYDGSPPFPEVESEELNSIDLLEIEDNEDESNRSPF